MVDVRGMAGKMTVMDRFKVGKHAKVFRQHRIKTVLLAREDQTLPDNFLENFLVNREVEMRIMTDLEAATGWLMTPSKD